MDGPPIQWQPISTLDKALLDGELVTLKVKGRQVLACWHTDTTTSRSYWWNGDVTDDDEPIEIRRPTHWAPVDLGAYRSYYEKLTGFRNVAINQRSD